jgi:hypothetical protein
MLRISPLNEFGNGDCSRTLLISATDVIAVLGGTRLAARLIGRGQSAACNWRTRDRFPPSSYPVMTQALAAKGLSAPAWLWDMEPRPLVNSAKAGDDVRDDLWSPSGPQ